MLRSFFHFWFLNQGPDIPPGWTRLCRLLVGLCYFLLLWGMLWLYGSPIGFVTWGFVIVLLLLGFWPRLDRRGGIVLATSFMAMFFVLLGFFLDCVEKWSLFDESSGRVGIEIWPGLRFAQDGPNTQLIQKYRIRTQVAWKYSHPLSGGGRDGDERVHSLSLVFSKKLATVLNRLPKEAAEPILECLTDNTNIVRVHQNLVLLCVEVMKVPKGFDSTKWWNRYKGFFTIQRDPQKASEMVYGLKESIEASRRRYFGERLIEPEQSSDIVGLLAAVEYQENGSWGGDNRQFVIEMEKRRKRNGGFAKDFPIWD